MPGHANIKPICQHVRPRQHHTNITPRRQATPISRQYVIYHANTPIRQATPTHQYANVSGHAKMPSRQHHANITPTRHANFTPIRHLSRQYVIYHVNTPIRQATPTQQYAKVSGQAGTPLRQDHAKITPISRQYALCVCT
jgi:hypothetical protein